MSEINPSVLPQETQQMYHQGEKNKLEDASDKQVISDKSMIESYEIVYGLGNQVAKEGDQVRIKFQHLSESGGVEFEKGPLVLTLGKKQYGRGFDDGIRGMKVEGFRELRIQPDLCPTSFHLRLLKKIIGMRMRSKNKKIFRVALLAILERKPLT
ncbi:uncharacterized protein LOC129290645 isoform X2 [Prosopis cineraria]|uniref:uncharacterized protein LOC129290645 isoform X2 n=1 Tax=Prosopis cineraria TaxID=364024 RepID=UPI00240FED2F|nr:uncharacterized protein LOC129290645 isoform X2 [Prosopis cineraria]XP_054783457.1 uncharacterized protein LOC129290645 isoform X2 [Prosopis cineraria]XP_054783458.1 uncharacterized protein LOC129290645 isoform X2 [Prosopis cineraria]XP_054783460.1 uncharacterized protein LOC129290645 isoform X2 [Prosopis cineraria]